MKTPEKKNYIAIVSVIIASLALITTVSAMYVKGIKSDVRFRDAVMVNDSLFWVMFDTQRGTNKAINKRIDNVVDTQKTINKQVLDKLDQIIENQNRDNLFNKAIMKEVKGMQKYDFLLQEHGISQNTNQN